MREFEQYAIQPGKKDIFVTRIEANGGADLNLCGKISTYFYGYYEFTVSPIMKISTVNAAAYASALPNASTEMVAISSTNASGLR